MKKLPLILLSASLMGLNAMAEETSNVQKNETKIKTKKSKGADKADELITNRRFRASNGSLSNFSMNLNMSYSGGSLEKPFAADRPNIAAAGDATSIAGIGGLFNGSYRINSLNRINVGAGVQMLAPFNDTISTNDPQAQEEFDNNRGELDLRNPFVNYTHMNKFFGVQTIGSIGYTQVTQSNFTDRGFNSIVTANLNTMYDFGGSAFSMGVLAVYSKYYMNNNDPALASKQADVVYGFLPQAEYEINDTYNLRTIVRSNWYQNSVADQSFTQRPITQSVGLGISLNRDVFLYPNIQFAPENLQAGVTNIGFTTNINMF